MDSRYQLDRLTGTKGTQEDLDKWAGHVKLRAVIEVMKHLDFHIPMHLAVHNILGATLEDPHLLTYAEHQWPITFAHLAQHEPQADVRRVIDCYTEMIRPEYVRADHSTMLQAIRAARLGDSKQLASEQPGELLNRLLTKYRVLYRDGHVTLRSLADAYVDSASDPALTSIIYSKKSAYQQACQAKTWGHIQPFVTHAAQQPDPVFVLLQPLAQKMQGIFQDIVSKTEPIVAEAPSQPSSKATPSGSQPRQPDRDPLKGSDRNPGRGHKGGDVHYFCSRHGINRTHTDKDCHAQQRAQSHATVAPPHPTAAPSHATVASRTSAEVHELRAQLNQLQSQIQHMRAPELPEFFPVEGRSIPMHRACGRFHRPDQQCFGQTPEDRPRNTRSQAQPRHTSHSTTAPDQAQNGWADMWRTPPPAHFSGSTMACSYATTRKTSSALPRPFLPLPITAEQLQTAPHAAPAVVAAAVTKDLRDQLTSTILYLQQQLHKLPPLPTSNVNMAWPAEQGVYHLCNSSADTGVAVVDTAGRHHLLPGVLLDNCSSFTLISAEVAHQLGLPLQHSTTSFRQSNGATQQLQHVVQLRLVVAHNTPHETHIQLTAVVAPGVHYQLLLGNDFNSALAAYVDPALNSLIIRPYWQRSSDQLTSINLPVSMSAQYAPISSQGGGPDGPLELLSGPYAKHPSGFIVGTDPSFPASAMVELTDYLQLHRHHFAWKLADLPGYKSALVKPFKIELDTAEPIVSRQRRYTPLQQKVEKEKVSELLEAGIIAPVTGPCNYVSCPTMPAKRDEHGNWTDTRYCLDFRPLNAHTLPDRYKPHNIDELFQQLQGSKHWTKLDLRQGFLQCPVAEEDQLKTSFWVGNKQYYYKRMPFGLRNATAYFQRVMDTELTHAGLTHCAICFVDDVLVHSATAEQHVKDVQAVLEALSSKGLLAHPDKCMFALSKVEFLGHLVTPDGISPQAAKIKALMDMPEPTNVSELRSILGIIQYYSKFIPGLSDIAAPLYRLTRKHEPWEWGPEQKEALHKLRTELSQPGKLVRPFDPGKPTTLYTDWSCRGVGAVLSQQQPDGTQSIVACISRTCNKHEHNYSSNHGELLAVVWAVKALRHYLHGIQFTIVTDHQPLQWLMSNQELQGQPARWALMLQDYDFSIQHRPGLKHQNADAFSRLPLPQDADHTGARLHTVAASMATLPVHHWSPQPPTAVLQLPVYAPVLCAASLPVSCSTADAAEEAGKDIWEDSATLQYLQHSTITAGTKGAEVLRIKKRAAQYHWRTDQLYRALADGAWRVVPPPAARLPLIQRMHEATGHFGVRRTTHLLRLNYWWVGLVNQVATVVRSCPTCDRVKASLSERPMQLQSLPIMGLCYRWGCDLAGDLPLTKRGNTYVLVCVEHLSKWVECIPIPNKNAATVAFAFLQHVLTRFAAPAEVITDGGTEFQGEFRLLLEQAHIDHRVTSANHPQADGLAERAVQTIKRALRKACDNSINKDCWDELLPWILLGYRCSPQQSTKLSPYEILYARPPVIPSAHRALYQCALDLDDPQLAADSVLLRATAAQDNAAMAANNLLVAQHRDQARYRHIRSGHYRPPLTRIVPGSFVYRRAAAPTTLHPSVGTAIYRVLHVYHSGRAKLIGSDGGTFLEHVSNLAPCHTQVNLTPFQPDLIPSEDHACVICDHPDRAEIMLLCDHCGGGYHTTCLDPPLKAIPVGDWLCPACLRAGITNVELQQLRQHQQRLDRRAATRPDTADKYRQLDGRWCIRPASKRHPQATWGKVQYLGEHTRPKCFCIVFSATDITGPMSLTELNRLKWLQAPGSAPGG